ncbi:spore gernimation protein [Sporosarcina sp. P34]|uniref:GerAB/ArcD/ProY family transporter n=1 Tax=Sporosarcina sp. P34 TaxID=2048247 RepID=UPI000C16DDF8|nr:GerAB/ArcD/ProY family transporter [Sporosarcina sp. P34]PID14143.1 spore gernimation protein [Sporosarcina sp. P34]
MEALQLFNKNETYNGFYVMLMVNRLQMLYFFLIMPRFLIHSYMIWVIIAVGILSQLNILLLSKWFLTRISSEGYKGFVQLFGKKLVRLLSFIGLFFILLKLFVILLGFSEMVQIFMFPATDSNWLIFFILLSCLYVAWKGVEKTIRFVVISFLGTFWMFLFFAFFFFPPIAQLSDLYPIIPMELSVISWKGIFLILSSFSGPEFLVFLGPWFKTNNKTFRYLSYGNALTVIEYVFLYMASIFYFGSNYLSKSQFPVVTMARYFQNPVIERMDMVMLSLELFNIVFAVSIFLLLFYGASKIASGKMERPPSRVGFLFSVFIILIGMILVNEWIWKSDEKQVILLNLQILAGSLSYLVVPITMIVVMKIKGFNKHETTKEDG